MNILALCLPEETEKGRTICPDDLVVATKAAEAGHDVVLLPYSTRAVRKAQAFDAVLNLCDGFENDKNFVEIRIARALEQEKIPFTGNRSTAFRLCNNKHAIKRALARHAIPSAPYAILSKIPQYLPAHLAFPIMVKPVSTDAGVGIYPDSVAHNTAEFRKNVRRVLKKHEQPALVETYLDGPEYCVPVLGNTAPKALLPIKLVFRSWQYSSQSPILSYEAKWARNSRNHQGIHTRPAKNPAVQKLAERAYAALGLRGYGSIDIRANHNGEFFVLEANPNCWIGPGSDTLQSAKALGMTHAQLVDKILRLATSS